MIALTEQKSYRTPRGHAASMLVRDGTADHNNVYSCLNEDEYRLASLTFNEGDIALDIGAHIGGVTVALALDNKSLHVIAVEALSANVEVLKANLDLNGIADRVTVIHGAAGKPGSKTAKVNWNFDESESGQHHRFIANAMGYADTHGETEKVDAWSLPDFDTAFCKIDCELCEYDVLTSPNVRHIREIRGEFHSGFERLVELLDATHVVTQTSGTEAFGGFTARTRTDERQTYLSVIAGETAA